MKEKLKEVLNAGWNTYYKKLQEKQCTPCFIQGQRQPTSDLGRLPDEVLQNITKYAQGSTYSSGFFNEPENRCQKTRI